MADANVKLSLTADTSGTKSAADDVVGDIARIGQAAESTNKKIRSASVSAQEIYKDDIRVLSLRASGLNGVADALEKQNTQRRQALELAKKAQISEAEALKLVRQRASQEERVKAAASARTPLPAMNRVQLSNAGGRVSAEAAMARGSGKSGDLNAAYYVAQDLVQGGPAAVANQVPIIVDLVKRYPMLAMAAIAAGSTYLAVSAYKYMRSQTEEGDDSSIGRRRISNSIANAAKMVRQRRAKAADAGTEEGEGAAEMHARVTRELAAQAQYRQGVSGISGSAEDARYKYRRNEAGDIADPEARIRKIAELDKEYAAAKNAAARRNLDDEQRAAEVEEAAARRQRENLEDILTKEKHRIAIGGQASDEEIKAVAKAKAEASALDARLKSAVERSAALRQSSQLFDLQSSTLRPLEDKATDQEARQAIEAVRRDIGEQGSEAFRNLRKLFGDFYNGISDDVKRRNESASKFRKETDEDTNIMDLRARGRKHAADKLEKQVTVDRDAEKLYETGGYKSREEAQGEAQKRYDLNHPNGRIKGAGHSVSKGERQDGGAPAPDARKTSPLDNYLMPGQHMARPGDSPGAFPGLDGLQRLQQKNHKIRGAGARGDKPVSTAVAEAAGSAAGPGGAALGGLIISLLSSISRKLDGVQPGRQTTRR